MTTGPGRLVIRWTAGRTESASARAKRVPGFAPGRLLYYLAVLPVIVVTALLGIIFLAAFLALSALAVMGVGLWFWRRRRRLGQSGHDSSLDGEFVVIPEARIGGGKADSVGDHTNN